MIENLMKRLTAIGRAHPRLRWPILALMVLLYGLDALFSATRQITQETGTHLRETWKVLANGARCLSRLCRETLLPLVMTRGRVAFHATRQWALSHIHMMRTHGGKAVNALRAELPELRRHAPRRAMAAGLTLCVLLTLLPVGALAAEEGDGAPIDTADDTYVELTILEGVPEAEQTAMEGGLDALNLPDTLSGIYSIRTDTEIVGPDGGDAYGNVEIPTAWDGLPDRLVKGEYTLTAVLTLPDGYVLAGGVEAPTVALTLTPDPAADAVRALLAALPAPEEVTAAMNAEDADFDQLDLWAAQAQDASNAYDALTDAQRELIPHAQNTLDVLMAAFRGEAVTLEESTYVFSKGSGTAADPWQIADASDLAGLANVAAGTYYVLTADIALSGEWTPISGFKGSLDGNGYIVSGLDVTTAVKYGNLFGAGLFGEISGEDGALASIRNLVVQGTVNVTTDKDRLFAGGIVGSVAEYASVENCAFLGSVTAESTYSGTNYSIIHAGGVTGFVMGYNGAPLLSNCYASGDVTAIVAAPDKETNNAFAGGVAGLVGDMGMGGNSEYCLGQSNATVKAGYANTMTTADTAVVDGSAYNQNIFAARSVVHYSSRDTGSGVYTGQDDASLLTSLNAHRGANLEWANDAERNSGYPVPVTAVEAKWGADADNLDNSGTLDAALASDAAYIQLQTGAALGGTVSLTRALTLDLNGQTADCGSNYLASGAGGSLTILDSGTGGKLTGGDSGGNGTVTLTGSGRVTLKSGTVESTVGRAIYLDTTADGSLSILGGTVGGAANGIYNASEVADDGSYILITGGTVTGGAGQSAIYMNTAQSNGIMLAGTPAVGSISVKQASSIQGCTMSGGVDKTYTGGPISVSLIGDGWAGDDTVVQFMNSGKFTVSNPPDGLTAAEQPHTSENPPGGQNLKHLVLTLPPEAKWGTDAEHLTSSGTLTEALASDAAYIQLQTGAALGETTTLTRELNLNLNGKTLTYAPDLDAETNNISMFSVTANLILTDNGNGQVLFQPTGTTGADIKVSAFHVTGSGRLTIQGGDVFLDAAGLLPGMDTVGAFPMPYELYLYSVDLDASSGGFAMTGGRLRAIGHSSVSDVTGLYSKSGGPVDISGGSISGTSCGVNHSGTGALTISDAASISSENTGLSLSGSGTGHKMTGGTVFITDTVAGAYGKAISLSDGGLAVSGGTITGGTNAGSGKGISASGGTLILSGSPVITGGAGVGLVNDASVKLSGALGTALTLTKSGGKQGDRLVVSDGTYTITAEDLAKLTYVGGGFTLALDGTGTGAVIKIAAPPHQHDMSVDCGSEAPITFEPWDGTKTSFRDGNTHNLYLTGNISATTDRALYIANTTTVNLCLNGFTVGRTGSETINVQPGGSLNICDCSAKQTGKVETSANYAVSSTGNLHLYGGTVTAHEGYAITVGGGKVYVNGGTVAVNENPAISAEVGNVYVSGGTIETKSETFDPAIKLDAGARLYLSGSPKFVTKAVGKIRTSEPVFANNGVTNAPIYYEGGALMINFTGTLTDGTVVVRGVKTGEGGNGGKFQLNSGSYGLKPDGETLVAAPSKSLSYVLNGGSWAEGYTWPNSYVEGVALTLPTGADIQKEGRTFLGWTKTNAADDVAYLTEIGADATGAVTFYAKWNIPPVTGVAPAPMFYHGDDKQDVDNSGDADFWHTNQYSGQQTYTLYSSVTGNGKPDGISVDESISKNRFTVTGVTERTELWVSVADAENGLSESERVKITVYPKYDWSSGSKGLIETPAQLAAYLNYCEPNSATLSGDGATVTMNKDVQLLRDLDLGQRADADYEEENIDFVGTWNLNGKTVSHSSGSSGGQAVLLSGAGSKLTLTGGTLLTYNQSAALFVDEGEALVKNAALRGVIGALVCYGGKTDLTNVNIAVVNLGQSAIFDGFDGARDTFALCAVDYSAFGGSFEKTMVAFHSGTVKNEFVSGLTYYDSTATIPLSACIAPGSSSVPADSERHSNGYHFCRETITVTVGDPGPDGSLSAPLSQEKVDAAFGAGNATLNQDGTTITINKDVTLDKTIEIKTDVTIDLGGHTVIGPAGEFGTDGESAFDAAEDVTATVTGPGHVIGGAGGNNPNGAGGNGGDGITGKGDIVVSDGAGVGGGGGGIGSTDGGKGGSGVNTEGNLTVKPGGSLTGGPGGTGTTGAGGQGGHGADVPAEGITTESGSTVTGGTGGTGTTGGAGGDGVHGPQLGGGSITIGGGVSGGTGGGGTGGNAGNGGGGIVTSGDPAIQIEIDTDAHITGGSGGSSTGGSGGGGGIGVVGGGITVDGAITGGSGGTGTAGNGMGGDGSTSNSGDITVNTGGSSTGGAGGTGNGQLGGTGGLGASTGDSGSTTVNGTVNGGNGGDGIGTANGGSGGAGANEDDAIGGSGTITGGNGGNIPESDSGAPGAGGSAITGGGSFDSGTATPGGKGVKATATVESKPGAPTVEVPKQELVDAAVTDGERNDADITSIDVKLTIEKKDAPTDAGAAESAKPANTEIGLYLDVKLEKTVTKPGGASTETVTQAVKPLTITITLPEALRGGSNYAIVRVHNGSGEALPTVYDGASHTLSAQTDKFSTYAIAYTPAGGTVDPPVDPPVTPPGGDDSGSGGGSPSYKPAVTKPEHGSVTVTPAYPSRGDKVTVTTKPDAGYVVDRITVTDKNGKTVAVTEGKDGKYIFTQPSGKVTIAVTYKPESQDTQLPFNDVNEGDWFYESVKYVYETGLMAGTASDTFSPYQDTSRGMIVTILWRLEGEPEATAASSFPDVAADAYCAEAVAWGAENGIVKGYSGGSFAPDDPITREQLAVILYRYAQFKGQETPTEGMAIGNFADGAQVSPWARDAMRWCLGRGIISGKSGSRLDPQGAASRAEAAVMLQQYLVGG